MLPVLATSTLALRKSLKERQEISESASSFPLNIKSDYLHCHGLGRLSARRHHHLVVVGYRSLRSFYDKEAQLFFARRGYVHAFRAGCRSWKVLVREIRDRQERSKRKSVLRLGTQGRLSSVPHPCSPRCMHSDATDSSFLLLQDTMISIYPTISFS